MKIKKSKNMERNKWKRELQEILTATDIQINGNRPWDAQIYDNQVYKQAVKQGPFGWGEAYIQGKWRVKELDKFFYKLLQSREAQKTDSIIAILKYVLKERIFNPQNLSRTFNISRSHYDLGNELFQHMLDKRMVYSCGYWKKAKNLDQAQEHKLDLVCRKIKLKPGMRILDIGCGWGSFLKFAVEKYRVEGVGIAVSKEQVKLGKELCKGLPVEIRLQDYRQIKDEKKFDCIVSLGMLEHVGAKNYRRYMEAAQQNLKDGGLFLIQTISCDLMSRTSKRYIDQLFMWILKYIFPNGYLPVIKKINKSIKGLFIMEDLHEFGRDYDKTLMAWQSNFANNWHKIESLYDKEFYRMWNFYLQSCAAGFRTRNIQLYQIVLSKNKKNTVKQEYQSVR